MKNLNRFNRVIWLIFTCFLLRPKFSHIGKRTIIFFPMQIDMPKSINIGNNVFIATNAWLMGNNKRNETLRIDDRTIIGHFVHIIANENVHIGEDVLIADKVFISDCTHSYENANIPICNQPIKSLQPVLIGSGSWIGENVCILGASVGKNCVVGVNSVVINDVPDFSVVAGNPAKVIKKYNFEEKCWIKC